MSHELLYKYRALEPFRYLVDALLKDRLYAAPYFDLNDPMEGQYIASPGGGIDEDVRGYLEGAKKKVRICSLSRRFDIDLMWAHYANGNRGIVLGVEVDSAKYDIRSVNYSGPASVSRNMLNPTSPQEILSRKLEAWSYEEEVRVFTEGSNFVSVRIREVLVGSRISNQDFSLLSELVERVRPELRVTRT